MEFVNQTELPAELLRAQLFYRDLLMATVIVKASFEVRPNGGVVPVPEDEQLAITAEDTVTPYGTVDGDIAPIKEGCDLAVMGPAVARLARPVPSMEVHVRIGEFHRELKVFGDRAWVPAGETVEISEPLPFAVMPLDYSRAYGGSAFHTDHLDGPYAPNPDGCGFVVRPADAAGTKLPNIEEPDQLIRSWEDRPTPASLIPPTRQSELRGTRGIAVDLEAEKIQYAPAAFSFAHPKMRLPEYPAGAAVDITGMTDGDPWRFSLPAVSFLADLRLGERQYRFSLVPDTLVMMPRHGRFYVVARRAFVYQFLPERERSITVARFTEPFDDSATTTVGAERAAKEALVPIEPEDPEHLPLPYEDLLDRYPLTTIIEGLPLCPSG